MAFFRLRIDPSPDDPAIAGCLVPVVCFGEGAVVGALDEGREAVIEGSLTERRWKETGGAARSRFEILARTVRVM